MKMNSLVTFAFLATAGWILSGCGNAATETQGSSAQNPGTTSLTLLNGTWYRACAPYLTTSTGTVYFKDTMTINGSSVSSVTDFYGDAQCTTTHLLGFENSSKLEYSTLPGSFNPITFVDNQEHHLTIYDDAKVTQANQGATCGFSDWAKNVRRDISNTACGRRYNVYDIYSLSGRQLYFGALDEQHDGLSAGGRPIALETDFPYIKQ